MHVHHAARRHLALAITLATVLAGCGTTPSPVATATQTAPGPTGIATTMPELPPWTCDGAPVHLAGTVVRAQLGGLDASDKSGLGRLQLTFLGPAGTPTIPEIEVRTTTPPFSQDPSGLPLEVRGTAWATIVLRGGTGIDPSGQQTYAGPTDLVVADGSPIAEVRQAGDFEAVSTWVVGLDAPYCVRVYRQALPNGLVVEFRTK